MALNRAVHRVGPLGSRRAYRVAFPCRVWTFPARVVAVVKVPDRGSYASAAPRHRPGCGVLPNFVQRSARLFSLLWATPSSRSSRVPDLARFLA